uniref:Uncharacterized protein n=1 Tax=mine drainage metagenome TaxID=410659 RepID=E6PY88_9ZZZZ
MFGSGEALDGGEGAAEFGEAF